MSRAGVLALFLIALSAPICAQEAAVWIDPYDESPSALVNHAVSVAAGKFNLATIPGEAGEMFTFVLPYEFTIFSESTFVLPLWQAALPAASLSTYTIPTSPALLDRSVAVQALYVAASGTYVSSIHLLKFF